MTHESDEQKYEYLANACSCCICHEIMIDPVTFRCGHNACEMCYHELLTIYPDCKCPICRNSVHKMIGINRTLKNMMETIGGQLYENEIQKRFLQIENERLLKKYHQSQRFKNLCTIGLGMIKTASTRNFNEVLNIFHGYEELEIMMVLHKLHQDHNFTIYQDEFVSFQSFIDYLIRNVKRIQPEAMINLLVSRFGIQDQNLMILTREYPNESEIFKRISKVYQDEVESIHKLVRQLNEDNEMENNEMENNEIENNKIENNEYEEEEYEEEEYEPEYEYEEEESEDDLSLDLFN